MNSLPSPRDRIGDAKSRNMAQKSLSQVFGVTVAVLVFWTSRDRTTNARHSQAGRAAVTLAVQSNPSATRWSDQSKGRAVFLSNHFAERVAGCSPRRIALMMSGARKPSRTTDEK